MRKSHPIKLLLQALLLGAVGFAMSVGSALAHGSGSTNHEHLQVHPAATYAEPQLGHAGDAAPYEALVQADDNDPGSAPCRDPSGHAVGDGCCAVACHAALAVPGIDALAPFDVPRARMLGLEDMLEGRSSDRTERPPKLS